jgi:iron(III) transport system substrate-binding protein
MAISRREALALGASFAASTFTPFTALGAAEDQLVEAARKEGSGVLLTVTDPLANNELLRDFKTRYGIDVESIRLTSAPIVQRFSAEVEADRVSADVVMCADPDFMRAAKSKGWFATVNDLPAMKGLGEEAWDGTLAAVQYILHGVIWNTNEVKELPSSWEVLVDPKWAGRVQIFDPRNSFGNVQWLWMLRQTYGEDFLRRLGKQATLTPSGVTGIQNVAAGSAVMFAPTAHAVVPSFQAKGAPIGEVIPAPVWGITVPAAVPAKAPHPNLGRLLLNYLMTREGQAVLNRDGVSFVASVPGTRPMPDNRWKFLPLDEAKRVQPELWKLLGLV